MTSNRKVERKVAPGIWKLNKNAYAIRVQVVDPQTGRRKNLKRTLRLATLVEAKQVRQQLLTHYDGTTRPEPAQPAAQEWTPPATDTDDVQPWVKARAKTARVTLGDFAASWLERKILRGDLQRLTRDRYAIALDRLSPRLQRMRIGDVMPDHIEGWMVAALREYAPITINSWRSVLRTVFNDARHELGLLVNPVDVVKPLRVSVNLEEPNAVSSSELLRLLEAVRALDRTLFVALLTQALTGMRWQEVSALSRGDIDWEERILFVRRKAIHGEIVPTTKTGRGREVGLSHILLDELRAYLLWLDESDADAESVGLLFFSQNHTPIRSSRVSVVLKQARADIGMERRLTSHGLRRTMTDLLRRAHVDPVVAKGLIGHTTDGMREHYSTVSPSEAREAADRVAGLVFVRDTGTDRDSAEVENSAAE